MTLTPLSTHHIIKAILLVFTNIVLAITKLIVFFELGQDNSEAII